MTDITLDQYTDPFQAIADFEQKLSAYTHAPYAVVTNCCTHAIEIALRLRRPKNIIRVPARTYLSVPMTFHKLGMDYELVDRDWTREMYYDLEGTDVSDCARYFQPGMYEPGKIQCVSFGRTKPLQIGMGGCILTDDAELAHRARMMCYDGRDIFRFGRWAEQQVFSVGFHYYLRPEECVKGINLLINQQITPQEDRFFDYPDCRTITILDEDTQ